MADATKPNDDDGTTAPAGRDDGLTHLDERGAARMVEVGDKPVTLRRARARATLRLQPQTVERLREGSVPKGDVLAVARVAAIMASKRTSELIPLCHPVQTSGCDVAFRFDPDGRRLHLEVEVRAADRTGVEMEALTAASIGALTVYDMVKAIERGAVVEEVLLLEKAGGRSGHWKREA